MKCQDVQQHLLDYSEQILDPHHQQQVEAHLHTCQACVQELRETEQMLTLLRKTELSAPPDLFWNNFTAGVMRQVRKADPPHRSPWFVFREFFAFRRLHIALVVALIGCFVAGLSLYLSLRENPNQAIATRPPVAPTTPTEGKDAPSADRAIRKIAPDQLVEDILTTDLALFNGIPATTLENSFSYDLIDVLLSGLTVEEKQALLAELNAMKATVP